MSNKLLFSDPFGHLKTLSLRKRQALAHSHTENSGQSWHQTQAPKLPSLPPSTMVLLGLCQHLSHPSLPSEPSLASTEGSQTLAGSAW